MRPIVILDITAIPLNEGWVFEDWLKLLHRQGIVMWDSKTGGIEPKVVYIDSNEEIEIRDINQLEFNFTYDN